MDLQSRVNHKHQNFGTKFCLNKHKKRLTQEQVSLLESNFSFNNKLGQELKSQLAMELKITPKQVAVWYQNKRAREKTQTLEVDHKVLRLRLESVVAENASLKEEIERLKMELNKVRGASTSDEAVAGNSNFVFVQDNFHSREFYGCPLASDGDYLFG